MLVRITILAVLCYTASANYGGGGYGGGSSGGYGNNQYGGGSNNQYGGGSSAGYGSNNQYGGGSNNQYGGGSSAGYGSNNQYGSSMGGGYGNNQYGSQPASYSAVPQAYIATLSGPSTVKGAITLTQEGNNLRLVGDLTGLPAGQHGFHIHEFGDLTQGCTSMGEHYNPANRTHGSPQNDPRHKGDYGNINPDADGNAHIDIKDSRIRLSDVIGRGLIVHEKVDDLGQGGDAESLKTGNAGARLACGVIGVKKP